jgi:hypothetical protein
LECVIPLFRSENALARHLDPRDIKAFRGAARLGLHAPNIVPHDQGFAGVFKAQGERLEQLSLIYSGMESITRRDPEVMDGRTEVKS